MNEEYWIWIEEQKKGPYKYSELKAMFDAGQIGALTLFCTDGLDDWRPYEALVHLHALRAGGQRVRALGLESDKRILSAFILWFFLGGIGAHRFYAEKVATGFFLLFCSVGGILLLFAGQFMGPIMIFIALIMLIIDLMLIVSGNLTDEKGRKIDKWT